MSPQGLLRNKHFADTLADSHCQDAASESERVRGSPRAGHRGRAVKRTRGFSSPVSASRKKRRSVPNRQAEPKSNYDDEDEDEDEKDALAGAETEWVQIRIDEACNYYDKVFRSLKQLTCKDIVKAWIRHCHPKKQTSHPYNGGKTTWERSVREYGYPGHFTRPDYWLSDEGWKHDKGIRHTEPDHLNRTGMCSYQLVPLLVLTFQLERLKLIIHLLRCQHKGFKNGDFCLDKLIQSTKGIYLECGDHWRPEYVERLEEVYRVRAQEIKYEHGEMGDFHSSSRHAWCCANRASDGDTMVLVQMPKYRCKSKAAVKTAKKNSKNIKKESKQRSSTSCNAPVANMRSHLQIQDSNMDLSEGSEPSIYADTSSTIDGVSPDASCPRSMLYRTRAIQHGLPFHGTPGPSDRRHNSVQENWTPRSANLVQDLATSTNLNPSGCRATPDKARRSLPLREQYRFGSSSMQSLPNQVVRSPFDNGSTGVAHRMRPNQPFAYSPPARPFAPKVENVRSSRFAASSSGLVGAYPTDADYTSWQTEDRWNPQAVPSMYTPEGDLSASLLPCTNASFGSAYSDAAFSTAPQLDTWNDGNQMLMDPYCQSLDDDAQQRFGMQVVGDPRYQHLGMDTTARGNAGLANQAFCPTDFRTRTSSSGIEYNYGSFSQDLQ